MKTILEYLAKAESNRVHKNQREINITSGRGIYRHMHPNAEIFKLIDQAAQEIGILSDSSLWTQHDMDAVNIHLLEYKEEVYKLEEEFYQEYLKNAHLELFPKECKVAMYSMYVNSQEGAWESVQQSLIDFQDLNLISVDRLSKVDGDFGDKTKHGLEYMKIMVHKTTAEEMLYNMNFKNLMLSNMKTYYAELAVKNPDKYLKYLNGWNNRMNKLQQMR